MKRILPTIILALWSYLASCDDTPTKPEPDRALFTATVVDTAGTPAPGLRVGSINHSDYLEKLLPAPQAAPSTEINFSLPEATYVTLRILDYYGSLVRQLLDSEWVEAGVRTEAWNGTDDNLNPVVAGFYRYHLTTSTGLSDEKWLVLEYAPDPKQTIIGETDDKGVFRSDDTLLFPCLLGNPPAIVITDEFGNVVDTALDYYHDTVTITLSDASQPERFLHYRRALRVGANSFELVWNPASQIDYGRFPSHSAGSSP